MNTRALVRLLTITLPILALTSGFPSAIYGQALPGGPDGTRPLPETNTPSVKPHLDFTLDVTEAPEMREWAEGAIKVCQEWYPKIALLLPGDTEALPTHIKLVFRKELPYPAATGGGEITCSVPWFKAHPDDVGALVHETVHVVQHYRGRRNPGWLVEGIADYIRWQIYEPRAQPGRMDPDKVTYHDAYRRTAAFLAYVTWRHGKDIVAPLNSAMREGKYRESIWKSVTGKTLKELGDEWTESLREVAHAR